MEDKAASVKSLNIFKKSEGSVKVEGIYKSTKVNTGPALIVEFLGGALPVTITNSSNPIPYRIVRVSDGVVTRTGSLNNGTITFTTPDSATVKYRLELIGPMRPHTAAASGVSFGYNTKLENILLIDNSLYGFSTYPQANSTYLSYVPANLPPSITSLDKAFLNCSVFNSPSVLGWDTSNVTNMSAMFRNASAFNQNISGWNTSNVTGMNSMFYSASAFNQNISGWDVNKVTIWSSFSVSSPLSSDNKPPKFR